ncbi:MAG: threonine synthase [Peptococcaceae bacterium]|jgi:threonine synthase|nr:threonine synthase [Peptococcaceae bacterium]
MLYVRAATCIHCGAEYPPRPDLTVCAQCGGVLEILYDYPRIAAALNSAVLAERRETTMWRYRELLPIEADSDTAGLRVGWSPLYPAPRLAATLGLAELYIKDDGLNPTASLKDRASALAVIKAGEAGADTVACSSTGNAASSLAGSAAARGLRSYIFIPARAPKGKVAQLMMFGANVISVQGNYEDAFRLSAEAIERWGWYNRNAAINPYLSDGKKTVSLEIAEQLGWQVPDYVAVSVGDGCTIAGVWKGFQDLYEIGLIRRLPRLISVQATGCCPINQAIEAGTEDLIPMAEDTLADSIAVGRPRNFHKAVRAVRASGGITVNVSDQEILSAMALLGKTCGVFGEPAGVTGAAGLIKALAEKKIPAGATAVSIVTGNGLKDIANAVNAAGEPLSLPPDISQLSGIITK